MGDKENFCPAKWPRPPMGLQGGHEHRVPGAADYEAAGGLGCYIEKPRWRVLAGLLIYIKLQTTSM